MWQYKKKRGLLTATEKSMFVSEDNAGCDWLPYEDWFSIALFSKLFLGETIDITLDGEEDDSVIL